MADRYKTLEPQNKTSEGCRPGQPSLSTNDKKITKEESDVIISLVDTFCPGEEDRVGEV